MTRARISPSAAPFPAKIAEHIGRIVPEGLPPFQLLTTIARDPRLFEQFVSRGFLGKGNLTLRQRELVINRTTAISGSEYEWGLHMYFFAARLGFGQEEAYSLVHGGADDPCWGEEDQAIIRLCDQLHATCCLEDSLWKELTRLFSDEAILEILMVAGSYRSVSYLTNALRLPPELCAPRFPAKRA